MKISPFLYFITISLISTTLSAQSIERSVVASAGTSVQTGPLQLDHTVGEALVTILESPDLVLTQGFHQGELMTTGLRGLPVQVSYKVFPNPVGDELNLALDGPQLDFRVALYDINGRPLPGAERRVKAPGYALERFDLSQQPAGVYLLVIMDERGAWLQSHRVVKP